MRTTTLVLLATITLLTTACASDLVTTGELGATADTPDHTDDASTPDTSPDADPLDDLGLPEELPDTGAAPTPDAEPTPDAAEPDAAEPDPTPPARCGDGVIDVDRGESCDDSSPFCVDCRRVPVTIAPRRDAPLDALGSAWAVPHHDLLLYRSDDRNLYLAPYDPSAPLTRVGHDLTAFPPDRRIRTVAVVPSGDRVIYDGRIEFTDLNRLYTATLSPPGEPQLLSPPDVNVTGFLVNAAEDRVIFWGDFDGDGRLELVDRLADGSSPMRQLTPPTVNRQPFALCEAACRRNRTPVYTPAGDTLLFAGQLGDGPSSRGLFALPVEGGIPVQLHTDPALAYRFSDDGLHLVIDGDDIRQISIADGTLTVRPLLTQVEATPHIEAWAASDDGQRLLAWGVLELDGVRRLYQIPAQGTDAATRVYANPDAESLQPLGTTPDGLRVLFLIRFATATGTVGQLWTAPLSGIGAPTRVDGGVHDVLLARHLGDHLLFFARRATAPSADVFVLDLNDSTARNLSASTVPPFTLDPTVGQDILRLSPDRRILRLIARTADDRRAVYVIDLDTFEVEAIPQPTVEHTPWFDSGRITADGRFVQTLVEDTDHVLRWNVFPLAP